MSEDAELDWRDDPKFAALRPIIEWMDRADADRTYALVQRNCEILAEAIRRPEAFRAVVHEADLSALADLHTFLDLLAGELAEQDAILPAATVPWVIAFRDMASSEAIKRGLILAKGHNPHDSALAACVAMTLGFSPSRAMQ